MSTQSKEPEGPDLGSGIALSELSEGEPKVGHLDGETVLLVRQGEEVFATGARCTHYGGDLGAGLITGDTVRCPLHHACFSLRTGEPTAPALNPLPVWDVEVREGIVHLGKKRSAASLDARGRKVPGPSSVGIIGAGAAGSAAAETLRREGYEGRIVMIDPDPDAPYDRPNLSKDYLAGSAPEEWIPLRAEGFYEENRIERVVASVTELDAGQRRLHLDTGREETFDSVLLATGANAARPRIDGLDRPHVLTLRSLEDCRTLIATAEGADRAVVIGSGFVGMEGASSLRARGLEVVVVSPDSVPFERTLGSLLGERLRRLHEANGTVFRRAIVAGIESDRVILEDGSAVPTDLVLVAVGARLDTALAEGAGLETDDGVVVDATLRTSAPSVYAAGDIARWPDPRWGSLRSEHWVVARRQGEAAARNILGHDRRYEDVPFFWTEQHGLRISYVGHATEWDRTEVDGDPDGECAVRFLSEDRTLAVATIGRDLESLLAERAFELEMSRDSARSGGGGG